MPAPLRLNVFPGGFNWPSFVAAEQGFFSRHGLDVTLQFTRGSAVQMTGLASGAFDVAITAFDNVVAYAEGQGEASLEARPDFFAFMGCDSGFLHLIAAPEITDVADLRGKTLSVDARTTGYAFVLFEILSRYNLRLDVDYAVERAGGMSERWQALRERRYAATLLSAPFNLLAEQQHFRRLARAVAVIGPYMGNVAATTRDWARDHESALISFRRAYVQAVEWLFDPGNRDAALAVLVKHAPMSPDLAEGSYDELLNPDEGFFRNGRVSMEGMRTVLALRSRYGAGRPTDPLKYYDQRYHVVSI